MKNYEYEYVSTAAKEEIAELMAGEHADAIEAWGKECANAAVKNSILTTLLVAVTGTIACIGVINKKSAIIDRYVRKNVEKAVKTLRHG